MIVAKYSSLAGGVFIEHGKHDLPEYQPNDRCFRFDAKGNAEYAFYSDLVSNGARARWYGHSFNKDQFVLA